MIIIYINCYYYYNVYDYYIIIMVPKWNQFDAATKGAHVIIIIIINLLSTLTFNILTYKEKHIVMKRNNNIHKFAS